MSDDDLDAIMNWADEDEGDYGYSSGGGGLLRGGSLRRTDDPPVDYDAVLRSKEAEVDLPPPVADDTQGDEALKESQKELDSILQEIAARAAQPKEGDDDTVEGPTVEEQEEILRLKLTILKGVRLKKEQVQWGSIKNRLFKPDWYVAKELRGTSYAELEHKTLADLGDTIDESRRAIHRLVHDNLDTFIQVKDVVDTVYVSDRDLFKGVTTAALVSAYKTATSECKHLLEKPFLENLRSQLELHGTWELFNNARDLLAAPAQVYAACGLSPVVPHDGASKGIVSEGILERIYSRFSAANDDAEDTQEKNPYLLNSEPDSSESSGSESSGSDSGSSEMATNHALLKEMRRELPTTLMCCNDVLLLPLQGKSPEDTDGGPQDDDGGVSSVRDQLRGYQSAAQAIRKCVLHLDEHYTFVDGISKGSSIAARRARRKATSGGVAGSEEEPPVNIQEDTAVDKRSTASGRKSTKSVNPASEDPLLAFIYSLTLHDGGDGDKSVGDPSERASPKSVSHHTDIGVGSDAELEKKQLLLSLYLDERRFIFRFCVSLLGSSSVLMETIHCALKRHVLGPKWAAHHGGMDTTNTTSPASVIGEGMSSLGSGAADTVFIEDLLATWMDVAVASVKIRYFAMQLQKRLREAAPLLTRLEAALETRGASAFDDGDGADSMDDNTASSAMSDATSAASSAGSASSFASSSLLSTDSLFDAKGKKKRKRTKDRVIELQQRTMQLKGVVHELLSGAQRAIRETSSNSTDKPELRTALPQHPVEAFLQLLNFHHKQHIIASSNAYTQCFPPPTQQQSPQSHKDAFRRLCRSMVAPRVPSTEEVLTEAHGGAYISDEQLTANLYLNQADLPPSPALTCNLSASSLLSEVAGLRRRVFARGQMASGPRTVRNSIPLFDRQAPVEALFSLGQDPVVVDSALEHTTNSYIARVHSELLSSVHDFDDLGSMVETPGVNIAGIVASATHLVAGSSTGGGLASEVCGRLNSGALECGTFADDVWSAEVNRIPEVLSQQAALFQRRETKRRQDERVRAANVAILRRRQQQMGTESTGSGGAQFRRVEDAPLHPSAAVLSYLDSVLRTTADTMLTYWSGIGSSAIHKGLYDYAPGVALPVVKESWGTDVRGDEEDAPEEDVVGAMCVAAVIPGVALVAQPARTADTTEGADEHASSSSSDEEADDGRETENKEEMAAAYDAVDDADTIESVVQVRSHHIKNIVSFIHAQQHKEPLANQLSGRVTVASTLKSITKECALVRRGEQTNGTSNTSELKLQVLRSLVPTPCSILADDCSRSIPPLNYVPVSNLPELVECVRMLVVSRNRRVAAEKKQEDIDAMRQDSAARRAPKERKAPSSIPPMGRSLRAASILAVLQMLCRCSDTCMITLRYTIAHNIQHGILHPGPNSEGPTQARASVVLELFISLWERMAVRVCDFIIEVKAALVTPPLTSVGVTSTVVDGTVGSTLQFLSQEDGDAIIILLQQLENMRTRTMAILQIGIALAVRAHLGTHSALSTGLQLTSKETSARPPGMSLRRAAGGLEGSINNHSFGKSVLGTLGNEATVRQMSRTIGGATLGKVGSTDERGQQSGKGVTAAHLESEKRLFSLRQRLSPHVLCTEGPVHVYNVMSLVMDRLMDLTLRHYELADGQANVYFNVLPLLEAARFATTSRDSTDNKTRMTRRRRGAADTPDEEAGTTQSSTAGNDLLYQSAKDVTVLRLLRKATESLALDSVNRAQEGVTALMLDILLSSVDSVVLKALVSATVPGSAVDGLSVQQPPASLGEATVRAMNGMQRGMGDTGTGDGDVDLLTLTPGELLAFRERTITSKHRHRLLIVECIADVFCLSKLVLPMSYELLLGNELWRGLAHIQLIHTQQDEAGFDGSSGRKQGISGKGSGALLKEIDEHLASTRAAFHSGGWFMRGGVHPRSLIATAAHGAIHQLLNRFAASVTADIHAELNPSAISLSNLDWFVVAKALLPSTTPDRFTPDVHPAISNVRPFVVDALVHVARAHNVLFRMVPSEAAVDRAEQLPQYRTSKKSSPFRTPLDANTLAHNIVVYVGLTIQRLLASIGKGLVAALTVSGRGAETLTLPIVSPDPSVTGDDAPLGEVEGRRCLVDALSRATSEGGMATQLYGYMFAEAELNVVLSVMDELCRNISAMLGISAGTTSKRGSKAAPSSELPDELLHPDLRHMFLVLPALAAALKDRGVQACEHSLSQFRRWEQSGTGDAPHCLSPKDREVLVERLTQCALAKNSYLIKAITCMDCGVQTVISEARHEEALRNRAASERRVAVKAARDKILSEIAPANTQPAAAKRMTRSGTTNDDDVKKFVTSSAVILETEVTIPQPSKSTSATPVTVKPSEVAALAVNALPAHSSSDDEKSVGADKKTKKKKKRKHRHTKEAH